MKETELRLILEKYGYKLEKITRFKTHDRLRIVTPIDSTLKAPLVIVLTLKKHLEDTSKKGILQAILTKDEFTREIKNETYN